MGATGREIVEQAEARLAPLLEDANVALVGFAGGGDRGQRGEAGARGARVVERALRP